MTSPRLLSRAWQPSRVARHMLDQGFAILPGVSPLVMTRCRELLHAPVEGGGLRHLFGHFPQLSEWLAELSIHASRICAEPSLLCRSILFDKTPAANWKVGWHQDVTLACAERFARPGWHNWTLKDGLPHVQPPVEVLEGMITLRLHLDACRSDNGPLRVLPGSHLSGRLSQPDIQERLATLEPVDCVCEAGQVLAMKPLLVHSSGSATRPKRRRVVHLEFCPGRLLPPEFKRIDPV